MLLTIFSMFENGNQYVICILMDYSKAFVLKQWRNYRPRNAGGPRRDGGPKISELIIIQYMVDFCLNL